MSSIGEYGPDFKPILGTEEATIDAKGRILVGKKRRERLGSGFAILVGPNGCLVAYPAQAWQRLVMEILQHDSTNPGLEQYSRLILGSADDELTFDGQGRVVIPSKMREQAKLRDKVLLIGCGDRMEIWAKEEFDLYNQNRGAYGRERRDDIDQARAEMKSD